MKIRPAERWLILALLVISVTINYIDRGNLSVAANRLSGELQIDPQQIGLLLSAFFWTYALMQVVSGWLIDRFPVYWIFALGFFLWSGATAVTGLASSFIAIFLLRLVLGVGESVSYPSYSKIIARGFPHTQIGLANGLIDLGSKAGPAIGLMIGGAIVQHYGWRPMFVVIGGASLLWLIPWCWIAVRVSRETKKTQVQMQAAGVTALRDCDEGPGLVEILGQRSAWGTFLCLFCGNYVWYFLLTWLPLYLVRDRHYSEQAMGNFGSLAFWAVGLSSLISGWVSDRLVARGGSPTLVRKMFAICGMALASSIIAVPLIESQRISLLILIFACIAFGCYSSHPWLISQTLAGPLAAGRWSGMQNCIGNLAGVVAPWLTGYIVKQTGTSFPAFVIVGCMAALGATSYLLLVGRIEPIVWRAKPQIAAL